jgi:hypothetical protein
MSDSITIISMIDGKPASFPVAKRSKTALLLGKCFTAYCENPIWFVHLTVHGKADIGKCYCCAQLRAFEYFVKKIRERGRWVMPEKGRPVEWRFDEHNFSFSPSPIAKKGPAL